MKKSYPEYRKEGMIKVEEKLSNNDKKVLNDFLIFCRATSNEYKVSCRKSEILQVRDIIDKEFHKWTLDDERNFLGILNHSNRSIWTKKGILVTLGMFIKWNYPNWSEKFNNLEELKKLNKQLKPDNEEKYKELPTSEEIDILIRTAVTVRDKLYISMASEAGLPPIVELNLKWGDVKIDEPQENISTLQYHRTKNNTTFIFPLGQVTTYYLKQWKQEYCYPNVRNDDFIFPSSTNRNKPLSKNTVWYMFKRLCKKSGLNKNIFQYKLRHKTLSDNYDLFTEEVHRKLFGHSKGSVQTKTYSHRKDNEKVISIALEKLHRVENVSKDQQNKYEKEIERLNKRMDRMERIIVGSAIGREEVVSDIEKDKIKQVIKTMFN